jgi:predicted nucleic acid-binding protein
VRYLLDTNVVSEIRKIATGKADPHVAAWNLAVDPADTYLSVIVVHELELGVRLLEQSDPPSAAVLRRWLRDQVIPAFADRTLPLDTAVAVAAARLHVPQTKPINDAYIAATAAVHHLTVATRNTADFAGLGVQIINPWEYPG